MSDPYRIAMNSAARRDLHRLPERVAPAIVEFLIDTLAANPLRLSKALTDDLTGHRSARRGDYRVVFRIDDDATTILVVRIGHRSAVYRPR